MIELIMDATRLPDVARCQIPDAIAGMNMDRTDQQILDQLSRQPFAVPTLGDVETTRKSKRSGHVRAQPPGQINRKLIIMHRARR